MASNAAGSEIAISESILRSSSILALVQAVDEFAVAEAPFAAGGVDADDPQLAELALACAAIAEGERLGPDKGFLGRADAAGGVRRCSPWLF